MRHHAEYHRDRYKSLLRYGDLTILKMAADRIFKSAKFLRPEEVRGPICLTMPNFLATDQTFAEIWRFVDFRWRSSTILALVNAYCNHPRRVLDGLYRYKNGWNRRSSFDNLQVLILASFA